MLSFVNSFILLVYSRVNELSGKGLKNITNYEVGNICFRVITVIISVNICFCSYLVCAYILKFRDKCRSIIIYTLLTSETATE